MKKTYEKPELNVEAFDTEDVITASGGFLETVGKQFEELIGNIGEMLGNLGQ